VTGIRVTTLENGLRVATDPMPGLRTATVGVWVGAGTRAEPAALNGVAHFLEHMAFKGTATRSARAIAEEIESVGGYLNAFTGREVTAYYAHVVSGDLPLAVDLIADILQRPAFDSAELERERGVILQEIGLCSDTPDDLVFDRFQEAAYPGQAMGRPVLGTVETVRAMTRDGIRDFMGRRYAGRNMVLCAAGGVDHDALTALAEDAFRDLPETPETETPPAAYGGGTLRDDRDSEQVHLVIGFEGPSHGGRDHYTAAVLSALLGGGASSRLFQSVREERGLVYSIHSFAWSFADTGLFGIYAGTGEAEVEELVPVIADRVCDAADNLSDEEIARAAAQVKAGLLMARESSGGCCDQLGSQLLTHGRALEEAEQIAAVDAVDRAALQGLLRRILASPPSIAAVGPLARLENDARIADRFRL
jgi:predicted Zn-dependent peptidase